MKAETFKSIMKLFLFAVIFIPAISISQKIKMSNPEEVGFSKERLERINKRMQDYIDEGKIAGITTLVSREGKVVHFETFGYADLDKKKKIKKDDIFRIYSMSKSITSVALMMLYEEGNFQLSDPVSKYIPELSGLKVMVEDSRPPVLEDQTKEIKIIDLLRHTSGLGYGWGPKTYIDSLYNATKLFESKDLDEFIQKVATIPLYSQPGTLWRYSISTAVTGLLVQRISGVPFNEFLEKNIFKPLKMVDTDFYVPKHKIKRFACVYYPDKEGNLIKIKPEYEFPFTEKTGLYAGGEGLVSTTHDYYRFCQMLLNGGELDGARLLSPKTIDIMRISHTDGIPPDPTGSIMIPRKGVGFGLGFEVITDVAPNQILTSEGVYGWGGMAGTYFRLDPEEDLIILFMMQIVPNNHLPVRKEFSNLVYQAIVD